MVNRTPYDFGLPTALVLDSSSTEDLEPNLPFELKADNFIRFAESDLKGDSEREVINALGNIKRAIHNRIDCLLYVFRYSRLSKDWKFPAKVEKLNELGIIAPRILQKINKIRNLLEHEYKIPNKSEVEDALDVAILFIEATKNFIKKFIPDGYYVDDHENTTHSFGFTLEGDMLAVSVKNGSNESEFKLDANDPDFDAWIKIIIEVAY